MKPLAAATETQRSKRLALSANSSTGLRQTPVQPDGRNKRELLFFNRSAGFFGAVLTKQPSANKSGAVSGSAVHANKICREHIKLADKSQSKVNS